MEIYDGMITSPTTRIRVPKGWGWEDWLYNEDYCGKILFFNRGKKCSWHYHQIKDEVLYIQSGVITMRYSWDDNIDAAAVVTLTPGMAFHVKTGLRHQMFAEEESYIFEMSTHHEDSDSHRVKKGD